MVPRSSTCRRNSAPWQLHLHQPRVRYGGTAGRRLLTLLNGTRERAALLDAMGAEAGAPAPHGRPWPSRDDLSAKLESKLSDLGALALLEA
jgi:hypothetical protein